MLLPIQKPRSRPLLFHVSGIEEDGQKMDRHQIPTWVSTALQLGGSAIAAYYGIDPAIALINRALDCIKKSKPVVVEWIVGSVENNDNIGNVNLVMSPPDNFLTGRHNYRSDSADYTISYTITRLP